MPQINASIPDSLIDQIQEIAKLEKSSFSKTVHELIEQGLRYRDMQNHKNANARLAEVSEKQPEYILRLVNLCSEIYRFTFNGNSQFPGDDADTAMTNIENKIKSHLYGDDEIDQ